MRSGWRIGVYFYFKNPAFEPFLKNRGSRSQNPYIGVYLTSPHKEVEAPHKAVVPVVAGAKAICVVDDELLEKYLPGPFTLILKKKDPEFLKDISSNDSLGVRIPDCEFTELVEKAEVPFITTSVNFAGEPFAVKISDIDHDLIDKVDIVIGVGELDGRPSTLVVDGKEIRR